MATITSPRTQSPSGTPRVNSPSITSTPSSSVRPSLEIPRNNAAGASSPTPQSQNNSIAGTAQRRNRAALRDYYNLKNKNLVPGAAGQATNLSRTASIASNASDSTVTSTTPTLSNAPASIEDSSPLPPQIDEPTFDADSYITEKLQSSSLRDVLRTEGTLVSEIRNLDGERKALVYDNYSKLIKAVSTIGEMQKGMQKQENSRLGLHGVEELQGRLFSLTQAIKELESMQQQRARPSRNGKTIDDNKTSATTKKRQKRTVKWILDTPTRLETLLETGQQDEAELQWKNVSSVLSRWKDVSGVKELRNACEKVMQSNAVS